MKTRIGRWASGVLIFCAFAATALAQMSSKQFVIDESKPYVYLKFDHIGDRKPANDWESSKGLWLRLVNNCGLPIKINVFDLGTGDPGVGVNFEVVPVIGRVDGDAEHQTKKPFGYDIEIGTLVTIPPKGDLLFSVPAESVTKLWSIKPRWTLPEGRSRSIATIRGSIWPSDPSRSKCVDTKTP